MTRSRGTAVFAALVLSSAVAAWGATLEDVFVGVLKRVGITDSALTSKKVCLCTGGGFGGLVGRLHAFKDGLGGYRFDCSVQKFSSDGGVMVSGECIVNGGTMTAIDK